jgi:eukaryotic-like serine/threonine-protein kinase
LLDEAPAMIDVGQTVGNYTITAKLGDGGMGMVFLAEHPVIGSKVAVKAIHPHFARNAEVVSRFVTEARAVNQIAHEHIVDITDFGNTPAGDFYFIMEYLQGEMLSDGIVRQGALPPARALNIAAQIADALHAAHESGVIHRDLKPENVCLITRDAELDFVKVLDFGLAKLTLAGGATPAHSTGAGMVMGTPYYMSPEQCQGSNVDHRSDIYALGVILFQMLTGRLPFEGSRYGEVINQHVTRRPPAPSSLVTDLPPEIDAILSRALSKDPGARFQTMDEFRVALLDLQSDWFPQAAPVIADEKFGTTSGHDTAMFIPTTPEVGLEPKRSRRGLFLVGVTAMTGVAISSVTIRQKAAEVVAAAVALVRQSTAGAAGITPSSQGASIGPSDRESAAQPAVAVGVEASPIEGSRVIAVPPKTATTGSARVEHARRRTPPGDLRRKYALGDDPDATLPLSSQ